MGDYGLAERKPQRHPPSPIPCPGVLRVISTGQSIEYDGRESLGNRRDLCNKGGIVIRKNQRFFWAKIEQPDSLGPLALGIWMTLPRAVRRRGTNDGRESFFYYVYTNGERRDVV